MYSAIAPSTRHCASICRPLPLIVTQSSLLSQFTPTGCGVGLDVYVSTRTASALAYGLLLPPLHECIVALASALQLLSPYVRQLLTVQAEMSQPPQ